jgi:hypothetical protein
MGTQIKSCGTSAGINRKIKLLKALAWRVTEAIAAKPGRPNSTASTISSSESQKIAERLPSGV